MATLVCDHNMQKVGVTHRSRRESPKNVVHLWFAGPKTRHEGPFSAPRKPVTWTFSGADDGIRTRDPNLGKVVLYQLSHVRVRRTL